MNKKYPYVDIYFEHKTKMTKYYGCQKMLEKEVTAYQGYLIRYLLVDTFIYVFRTYMFDPKRRAKATFKHIKTYFDAFVGGIIIKEEEEMIEKGE